MKASTPLDTRLRFPRPTIHLAALWTDPPVGGAEIAPSLDEVRGWRQRVLHHLLALESGANASAGHGLTPRVRRLLLKVLLAEWSPPATEFAARSPYHLTPFPDLAGAGADESGIRALREVLRWRAALVDFLSDIWDVFDEPWLDVDDCMAMERYLQPLDDELLCSWCLSELDPKAAHQCPLLVHVCAKWPEAPFKPSG